MTSTAKQYCTFLYRQLICMIIIQCTLQLTAGTDFLISSLYLCKHFSKKLNKSLRMCYFYTFPVCHAHCIILVRQSILYCHHLESLKHNEISVTIPFSMAVTIPRGISMSYNYQYFKLQRNSNSLSILDVFNSVHN